MDPEVRVILTDNLGYPQLIPSGYSNAVSDFQRSWGVSQRTQTVHGLSVSAAGDYRDGPGEEMTLIAYNGSTWTARSSEVLFVVFRPDLRFAHLPRAFLRVTRSFDHYQAYKRAEAGYLASRSGGG